MDKQYLFDHVLGSLAAAFIGDAMGSATEALTRQEIVERFGGKVTQFHAPGEGTWVAGQKAGQMTDDTTQMIEMIRAVVDSGGHLKIEQVVQHMLKWAATDDWLEKFAGPSTEKALKALRAGEDPHKTGLPDKYAGDTRVSNGAAMKVAPAGLAHPGDINAAVEDAVTMATPTHHTDIAFAGAAATAAAVAKALMPGVTVLAVADAAVQGAEQGYALGAKDGCVVRGPSVTERLKLAIEIGASDPDFDRGCDRLAKVIGCGLPIAEAVPTSVGIFVAARGDPNRAIIGAVNLGDDADTVAAITGSIAGAYAGINAVDQALYEQLQEANNVDLASIAQQLVDLVPE